MRIHLIGVCGTAMGTLAAMLKRHGHDISGSDEHVYPPMSDFLAREGIAVWEGYRDAHVEGPLDLVVIGNAISRGNPELEAVLDRKQRYTSLPAAVRDFFLWGAQSIVVAGTHGKTTTTALAGWLLTDAGLDPTVLVGGIARNFGEHGASYRLGRGRAFVIEGDEYDSAYFDKTAKFLKYLPDIAVVNNLEFDHADIYADLEAVRQAFRRLVDLVPRRGLTLVGLDSPEAAALVPLARGRVQTFGLSEGADWRAMDIECGPRAGADVGRASGAHRRADGDRIPVPGLHATTFRLVRGGVDLGLVTLPLAGEHNVRNALAAIAVGVEAGVPLDRITDGLSRFLGVKRRLEVVGTRRGVTVYDDFAHHPTAVAETLRAVRRAAPGCRIWAVFEPRSASSCRRVFQADFARAFGDADQVVVASVFRASLPEGERLSEGRLVADLGAAGIPARHLPTVGEIVSAIADEAREGDLVVVMSNGGFGDIHRKLLGAL
jgi:UDP-N-acetylmuramate: L-alanyl-gamma-D-glutamyl-meso-diaminopimelate ligase